MARSQASDDRVDLGFGDRAAVADRLVSILAALTQQPSVELADGDDFLHKLGMDSIAAVELTIELDAVFDIGFGQDPDDIDSLATFGRLVDLVVTRASPEALGQGRAVDARC